MFKKPCDISNCVEKTLIPNRKPKKTTVLKEILAISKRTFKSFKDFMNLTKKLMQILLTGQFF